LARAASSACGESSTLSLGKREISSGALVGVGLEADTGRWSGDVPEMAEKRCRSELATGSTFT
jgi:hypothetical protein